MADNQEEDQSQKTEQATEKRLEDARKKGQIPMSKELNHLFILAAGTLVLLGMGPFVFKNIALQLKSFFLFDQYEFAQYPTVVFYIIGKVGAIFVLPALVFIVAALAAGLSQTRFNISLESIKPKWEKLSLFKGIKRQLSLKHFVEFLKGMAKIIIVGIIALFILSPVFKRVGIFPTLPPLGILQEIYNTSQRLWGTIVSTVLVIAILDYMYQRFEHMKKMKMSKKEIKDETKDSEGDPHVKQRQRQLRQEKAKQRMIAEVPKATVVITNPTHYAIALKYEHGTTGAPVVVAKGVDVVAFKIREAAQEAEVPIVENPPLARTLYDNAKLDQEIPEEYYEAVAKVIRYIMGLEKTAV